MTDQYPAEIIFAIRDGQVIFGCEPIADLADVINPDLIRREVTDGQGDDLIAPLDEWCGEIHVPVSMGLLV